MRLFNFLFGKKKPSIFSENELISEGVCPNCWGRQEYEGKYIQLEADLTKDNINHNKQNQKAFIQQFVETNVTGIRLKKDGDFQTCPSCKMKYKFVSGKAN